MYTNKCIKCGCDFETKNPKRVICPNCLYSDRKTSITDQKEGPTQDLSSSGSSGKYMTSYSSYSFGGKSYSAGNGDNKNNRYNKNRNNSYNKPGYNKYNNQNNDGSYYKKTNYTSLNQNKKYPNQRAQNQIGDRRPQGTFSQNKFNTQGQTPYQQRKNPRKMAPKPLLISKEQLSQIEELYKPMLPLPNQDCHEKIGELLQIEPRKVFFGINLIRQKMMLPKLNFPKRKLAVTEDQVYAIKSLYEPLLPMPPIGCHKIIAAQLKMDEWRVHVGIGVVRRQMGLSRWNETREDLPEKMKKDLEKMKINKMQKKGSEIKEKKALKKDKPKKKEQENKQTDELPSPENDN